MKAKRFIVEAKSPCWRALPGNAFWLEHGGLNLCRGILHCGLSVPAAEPGDSDGGGVWRGNRLGTATFLKADGLTSPGSRGRGGGLTREGRCQLRPALILAHSSAAQPLPVTSSHNYSVCVGGGCTLLSGELKAQQEVPAHVLWILAIPAACPARPGRKTFSWDAPSTFKGTYDRMSSNLNLLLYFTWQLL